ncbi:DUF695 domain-containing protein [Pseudomonas sp. P9_35]|uniref:DUF695 domain-containing protein n=1 Tax=unclassified Pseudomonas TaxID=196821 RepID=UPI002A36F97B|nr:MULTISPECIES: DUF695 domain-containing protein [unclassified Pseudomonas]WPN64333.1 DUF695 domain-containing protein [Pseudomonas sp. P9_32]WPN70084.1 DUF695 domain-containing protein [Pseudomonas sp. P9_35]
MVTEKSERPLMESGHGVQYVTAKLRRQRQDCKLSGSPSLGLGLSQMGVHNRFRLLALVSVLIAGCSSSKTHSPPPVERDRCLDAGPVKSVEYDNCVADRGASQSVALSALLDDTGDYPQPMEIVDVVDDIYQPSDFPDTPVPMLYKGAGSISTTEKRALPFKVKVTWKYSSKGLIPALRDRVRMNEMERLILPAMQDKGLAKWVCTVTGGKQREWIFYTRNDEAFIAQTRAILAQTGPYPIELSARKEPALSTEMQSGESLPENIRITPKTCVE